MKRIAAMLFFFLASSVVYAAGLSTPAPVSSKRTRSYFVQVESPGRQPMGVTMNVFPGETAKARVGIELSYVMGCTEPSSSAPVSLIPATTFDGVALEVTASPTTDEVTIAVTDNNVSEIKTVVTSKRCSYQQVDATVDKRTTSGLGLKVGASLEGLALGKFVLTVHRGQDR